LKRCANIGAGFLGAMGQVASKPLVISKEGTALDTVDDGGAKDRIDLVYDEDGEILIDSGNKRHSRPRTAARFIRWLHVAQAGFPQNRNRRPGRFLRRDMWSVLLGSRDTEEIRHLLVARFLQAEIEVIGTITLLKTFFSGETPYPMVSL